MSAAPFNHAKYRPFPAIQKTNRRWPSQTIQQAPAWCSVDLRDGNQALIEPMTVEQKQRMWRLLVNMGFKEIEVGFPAASQPDFDFVRWLIEANQIPEDVTIQVLVQARDELIERTFEAVAGARRVVVHVYNSTSPVQRDKVFALDKQGIIDIARHGASKVQSEAKKFPRTEWVFQYSPESFSSTEVDFAVEVCNAVIDQWQPTPANKAIINLPATVECAMPNVFADQVEYFCDHVHQRDALIISIHTHNDRGCAVAAAELAILAGADRIEGTLLGNGERTGNMDIVTMAMNLYSQGIDPQLDLSQADDIIATVEACTSIKTHPRHPWLGELVYTAFSGSHQDAIRKCLAQQTTDEPWDVAYLPIDPQDLGRTYQSVIRVNSQSGKGGAAYLLEQQLGIELPRWLQVELAQPIQALAEQQQGEVEPQQVLSTFRQHFMEQDGQYQLSSYQIDRQGNQHHVQASLTDANDLMPIHGQGSGAISAFIDGIHKATGVDIQVVQFDEHSLDQGSEASALALIQATIRGKRYTAVSQDSDIVAASLNAVLSCLNKAIAEQQIAA
ncbi:2-isopropylmalate synthase [Bacterioplanoides sp. SCSIO 12839]|uniref:2-isopropylmalate synthase n=1 Tax=Bacterioplanoides sp. SCSIO 12839 TaxID=2829569 RepID=UPI002107DFA2|nr:2-isopropylmalate synthase [Bacterioplanoides sp. SCSIO 12839]UTW47153.1 2-isopropylmalate synthase [Bacterioplanoides sp. SCSIO 12839]